MVLVVMEIVVERGGGGEIPSPCMHGVPAGGSHSKSLDKMFPDIWDLVPFQIHLANEHSFTR